MTRKRAASTALALGLIVGCVAAYYYTIGHPRWQNWVGFNRPAATVAYGQALELDGVSWRIHVEDADALYKKYKRKPFPEERPPKGGKVFMFTVDRSRNGTPITANSHENPPNISCGDWKISDDRGRTWTTSFSPYISYETYGVGCTKQEIPIRAFFVPEDARITALQIWFYKTVGEDKGLFVRFSLTP